MWLQFENGEVMETDHPEWHADAKKITAAEGKRLRRENARKSLLARLRPGQVVYTLVRSVAASGMSRRISCVIVEDGEAVEISGYVAQALGWKWSDKGGVVVSGCGMDMGFHIVHSLGHALWPEGTPEPHGMRNGEPDSAGGYALTHRWL